MMILYNFLYKGGKKQRKIFDLILLSIRDKRIILCLIKLFLRKVHSPPLKPLQLNRSRVRNPSIIDLRWTGCNNGITIESIRWFGLIRETSLRCSEYALSEIIIEVERIGPFHWQYSPVVNRLLTQVIHSVYYESIIYKDFIYIYTYIYELYMYIETYL